MREGLCRTVKYNVASTLNVIFFISERSYYIVLSKKFYLIKLKC